MCVTMASTQMQFRDWSWFNPCNKPSKTMLIGLNKRY